MINVTNLYDSLRNSATRNVDFAIGRIEAETMAPSLIYSDKIIDVEIEQIGGIGGIGIGNVFSSRLMFRTNSLVEWENENLFAAYVGFFNEGEQSNGEWLNLGMFVGKETSIRRNILTVTAFDRLYETDVLISFDGVPEKGIAALPFPAKMQEILNYTCAVIGITNVFECQDFTVEKKPEGYTQREILKYISASHGGNCEINNHGRINIKQFKNTQTEILKSTIVDMSIDMKTAFKVNGIAFHVGNNILFIDGDEEEYSDDRPGIIHVENPFVTIEIAEYVWNMLGGMEYHSCTIEKQGLGTFRCGDMVSVRPIESIDGSPFNIVITSLKYSLNASIGFKEFLISDAMSMQQSVNRNKKN
jgi:hypothetical protein